MDVKELTRRVVKGWSRYKYVLLILLAGVILLAWPTKDRETGASEQTGLSVETNFQVEEMEDKLAKALSRVEGAGEVTVVLTVKEGPRQLLAQDGKAVELGGQVTRETSTVVVSRGSGTQEAVPLARMGPVFQGALVVARGGDDPKVRLALSEAVSALTGLGTDKISICKGK